MPYDTSLPFYQYYQQRNAEFFYPPSPFLPIHPFLIFPQYTSDFNYQHHPKTSIFLIEDNATVEEGLIEINIDDFLKEDKYKNVILAPVITSNYETKEYEYDKNKIENTKKPLSNYLDKKLYYNIIDIRLRNEVKRKYNYILPELSDVSQRIEVNINECQTINDIKKQISSLLPQIFSMR